MIDKKEVEKLAKELLSHIVSEQIDNDIKLGKHLQDICKNGDKDTKKCSFEHKIDVINYIDRVDKIYHPFVILYLILNNYPISIGNSSIDCHALSTYVFIIEKVKEAKNFDDDFEHLCELLTIKK